MRAGCRLVGRGRRREWMRQKKRERGGSMHEATRLEVRRRRREKERGKGMRQLL